METTIDESTGETVIRATIDEVAALLAFVSSRTGGPGTDSKQAQYGNRLAGILMGTPFSLQGIRFELDPSKTPSAQDPKDDCHKWAVRKALDTVNTFPDLLELRTAAETDARADFLLDKWDRHGVSWKTFLEVAKNLPSENPPGVSPMSAPHRSHRVEMGMDGACIYCGKRGIDLATQCEKMPPPPPESFPGDQAPPHRSHSMYQDSAGRYCKKCGNRHNLHFPCANSPDAVLESGE